MDWHKTYILPERLYASNQEKKNEMYIHVKFKLCIFRNRFLNISNKDHVGIHYHILHWSMCYIFITRRACKTNHTLWIMPCFSRQICRVWSQTFPSAGGRRKQRLLQHSSLSILCRRIPLPRVRCAEKRQLFQVLLVILVLFWLFQAYCSAQESFSWQQFVPRASPGWCCLGKVLGFLEGLSASGKPLSFHLTILHFPRLFRDKINCFFCPPLPKQNLECLRHWNGLLTADLILASNL